VHEIGGLGGADDAEYDSNEGDGSCCFEDKRVDRVAGCAFDGVVAVCCQFGGLQCKMGGCFYTLDRMLIQAWIMGESAMELHTAQVM